MNQDFIIRKDFQSLELEYILELEYWKVTFDMVTNIYPNIDAYPLEL